MSEQMIKDIGRKCADDVSAALRRNMQLMPDPRSKMSEPPSDKQINLLGIDRMSALGMTKYEATCLLQWKFSERAIRWILEGRGNVAA